MHGRVQSESLAAIPGIRIDARDSILPLIPESCFKAKQRPLEASLEEILRADSRAGARAILASIAKRRFENRSEGQRLAKSGRAK